MEAPIRYKFWSCDGNSLYIYYYSFIYTLFWYSNKKLWKNLLRKILIQSISSLYSVLILFIKKKDSSLYFCIDFCSLNYISKKDCYLLISNLLNSFYKAQVYIKINLCYIYHLVCIANSNKWKTAFKTCYRLFE